ncbi:hypothetical protein QC762_407095 [Podospora pseudocomata]|uniref:Uncharacterized protein n=1 Tax=Podospora pseudocomata TaxID=2093779 RepID=A0ABR0GGF9_9PEZI|nr:hypothetical protein QC762_407095 [Podospora pseudocomata]
MQPRDPPWARRRRVRHFQNNFLVPGEFMTEIGLITETPNYDVVRLPGCLISPRFRNSYMLDDTAHILGGQPGEYPSREMTADETRMTTFTSPLGPMSSSRTVVAVFEIQQLSLRFELMRFLVVSSNLCREQGISVILGLPFIQWYQARMAMLPQPRLALAADTDAQYAQDQGDQGLPNSGGGGQECGNRSNVDEWVQRQQIQQMPVVIAADESVGTMEGAMNDPELNTWDILVAPAEMGAHIS